MIEFIMYGIVASIILVIIDTPNRVKIEEISKIYKELKEGLRRYDSN